MTIRELLLRYGLLAVFFGAATEGDVTMILAGVTAHLGLLDLPAAMVIGALGGFVGDIACYGLGRARAASIRRSGIYRQAGPVIERFVDRFGVLQIGIARFIYGTRIATMLFWGIRGLPLWRFASVDLPGCLLWAAALGGLGFMASNSAAALIGRVTQIKFWLLGALLVSAAVFLAIHLLFRILFRWRRRRAGRPAGRPRP